MTSTVTNGAIKPLPSRRQKRKSTSTNPFSHMKDWLVQNQIRMPLTALSALGAAHLFVDQPYTAKFFALSHFNPATQLYNKGQGDWPFVFTWVLLFTLLRVVLMRYAFEPFFYHFAPHPTIRTATRFAEQAWSVLCYSISFLGGLYIVLHSPYWGNTRELWAGYPQIENDGLFKAYYLVEMAFWIQQVFVLNIEARRKDFWQMFCHHIVTCTLIFMSYTYNVTAVGNVILCVMDFSDILLSSAKLLKYLELQRPCDATFFLFLISWPYTRHYLYTLIVFSAYFDAPVIFHRDNKGNPSYQSTPPKGGGPWGDGYNWNPQEGYYFTREVHLAFICLLATLQALLCLWFFMIIRLAVRVIRGAPAEDVRSDDEDEGDLEDDSDETLGDNDENPENDVVSLSVVNGNIPSNSTTNGIAFTNGIHQRKRQG